MKKYVELLFVLVALSGAFLIAGTAHGSVTAVDAQVTPLDDEPDDAPGLGSIVGSPEAGPDPDDAGDRGGYAQLAIALLLPSALLFIAWRVVREARSGRDTGADTTEAGEPVVKRTTTHNKRGNP